MYMYVLCRLMHVYLADFGLAKVLTESGTMTSSTMMAGTPGFQAPEQLKRGKLSPKCDVYAFGGVITELFGCKLLWPKMSAYRIMVTVTVEGGFPATNYFPEKVKEVTALCFTTADKRANIAEVLLKMLNML